MKIATVDLSKDFLVLQNTAHFIVIIKALYVSFLLYAPLSFTVYKFILL